MPPIVIAGAISAGASIGGALINKSSANKAAEIQAEAARKADEVANKQAGYVADTGYGLATNLRDAGTANEQTLQQVSGTGEKALSPYLEAGTYGVTALKDLGQNLNKPVTMADLQLDPGFQFRMEEGQKALERSASARGGLLGGGTLKSLARYSQGVASDEYQKAFDRYQTDNAARFSRLSTLTGVGQNATGSLLDLSKWYGTSSTGNRTDTESRAASLAMGGVTGAADLRMKGAEAGLQGANASAAGTVASGNAWAQGLSGAGSSISNAILLSQMLKPQTQPINI
jgi:hypothetical protein